MRGIRGEKRVVGAKLENTDVVFFFVQAEDGIRDPLVTGVQTWALPIGSGQE